MTTQTLRGLANTQPYHWRGDQPNFAAFNPAFAGLLGGSQLSVAEMAAFTNFINTIAFQPNPNLNLDGTMPATLPVPNSPQAGDPTAGLNTYINTITGTSGHTCIFCHPANPGTGTNGRIDAANTQPAGQPMKHSQLRNQYQKTNANFAKGAVSVNGFGFNNDGTDMGIFQFLGGPEFAPIQSDPTAKANLSAYVLCFNAGTAPPWAIRGRSPPPR